MKDKNENITYLPAVQIQDDGMKFKWGDSEFDLWNRMTKEQENAEAAAEMEMAEHWSEEDETAPFPISGTITVRHENAPHSRLKSITKAISSACARLKKWQRCMSILTVRK